MGSGGGRRWHDIVQELILIAGTSVSTYFLVKFLLSKLEDPETRKLEEMKRKSSAILRRLDASEESEDELSEGGKRRQRQRPRTRKEELVLSQYEHMIAMDVVHPEDIPVSFKDIGGLEDTIEELKESVIYPLTMPQLYTSSSSLLTAPSGVLLYGPPGCGKTMLAKALAHESRACFINLRISTLTEKWYGDSNKLVNAAFSLARKLEPSIVFIDEIDAVLGTRRTGEHEASGMIKAEFMTHWDGLTSANAAGQPQRVLILGATNRIEDIDDAILRRMPKKFGVPLPDEVQRLRILRLLLRGTNVDGDNLDEKYLVRAMAGMSGSDMKEACRDAALVPVRELIRRKRDASDVIESVNPSEVRGLTTDDFFRKTSSAHAYHRRSKSQKGSITKALQETEWSTDSEANDADTVEAKQDSVVESR